MRLRGRLGQRGGVPVAAALLLGTTACRAQTAPTTPPAAATAIAPTSAMVAGEKPTAIVLLGSDGTTYYRSGIRPATADADKLAAVTWLTQRSPDALARVLPDGGGILVRRDRRATDGKVLQNLYLIKPATGGGVVDEALPFDTTAFAVETGLDNWRLRAISGLQVVRGSRRALLRLTFEKPAAVEATAAPAPPAVPAPPPTAAMAPSDPAPAAPVPPETREFLGWYNLDTKTFTSIFDEPRLVGAELSMDGHFIHVLAQRGADGSDPTALILDDDGKTKPTPVLAALRTVGYLYRGWVDGRSLLLKKAGQDQVVVYDAATDTATAPAALNAFAASQAPAGNFALTWTGEPEDTIPAVAGPGGTAVPLEFEGPVTVSEWSADGRFALLLGARNERRQATKVWLLETEGEPRLREIVVPGAVSAARFLYEAL